MGKGIGQHRQVNFGQLSTSTKPNKLDGFRSRRFEAIHLEMASIAEHISPTEATASAALICEEIPHNPKKLIQKVSQRNLLLFFMPFNILKVPFILTIRKGSFSRWRPIWLPRAKSFYIQGNIQHTQVFLVSNRRL